MTQGNQQREGNPEQVTITDKRRIDPETGEVRAECLRPGP